MVRKLKNLGYEVTVEEEKAESKKPDYIKNFKKLKINNDSIVIIEYIDVEVARNKVQDSKSTLANPLIDFIDIPHLFYNGVLELTYFGTNNKIIDELKKILGTPLVG